MKVFRKIMLALVGIAAIVLGALMLTKSTYVPDYADSATFGADFYTYTHRAICKTANNVRSLEQSVTDLLKEGFGYSFIIAGACMVVCALPGGKEKPQTVVVEPKKENYNDLPML